MSLCGIGGCRKEELKRKEEWNRKEKEIERNNGKATHVSKVPFYSIWFYSINVYYSILFSSVLFSLYILFHSILSHSILFYSVLYTILFIYSIPSCLLILFYTILFCSILFYSVDIYFSVNSKERQFEFLEIRDSSRHEERFQCNSVKSFLFFFQLFFFLTLIFFWLYFFAFFILFSHVIFIFHDSRYFRIIQTGMNSSGNHALYIGGLELYGTLTINQIEENSKLDGGEFALWI